MHPISILFLGLAMSTDAFAAAVGKGAAMQRPRWADALRTGLIFGVVEAITPVIGWALGSMAEQYIEDWDHWIAFALLSGLGLHMIWKALHADTEDSSPQRAGLWALALAGLATSIDAMAVGVGLAFIDVNILVVAITIGLCTFGMVTAGVMAGSALGALIGKRAEIAGGVILILVGMTIVYEHVFA
ncbi:MAG: manganese efflux pump MntP family protein [Proteobacteria bacterium]|nr:manganese efflux pump MntP family protein [Pseudomonadota bacterium]